MLGLNSSDLILYSVLPLPLHGCIVPFLPLSGNKNQEKNTPQKRRLDTPKTELKYLNLQKLNFIKKRKFDILHKTLEATFKI